MMSSPPHVLPLSHSKPSLHINTLITYATRLPHPNVNLTLHIAPDAIRDGAMLFCIIVWVPSSRGRKRWVVCGEDSVWSLQTTRAGGEKSGECGGATNTFSDCGKKLPLGIIHYI
jgi:hypothetical protein